MKDEKIIETAKKRFKDSEDTWSENRNDAIDDIKFSRLGQQWEDDVLEARKGRPCLTINRLPAFIRQVVNDSRINDVSIKVHPIDDNTDPDTAEIINGVIRNIEITSNAEVAYDNALEYAVTCGFGFFRVNVDYTHDDAFDKDIVIEPIHNPTSVYFDSESMAADASDWRYCFIVDTMSKEDFKERYPNAEQSSWETSSSDGWSTEEAIRVCEYWDREEVSTELYMLQDGTVVHKERYEESPELQIYPVIQSRPTKTWKVTQYIITGTEIIETNDWAGRYIPIVPCFGDEVVVEDKRYFLSLVRHAKDAQRNYNYWRSASTERVALATKAPWIGQTGAFDTDFHKWETANSETHAYIQYDGNIPPIQTPPSMADAGSITEALSANDDMKNIIGLGDSSLGMKSNETSGKAIMARQREGDVSTFHFIDNLSRAIRYAGKVILDLIPHVYSRPRTLRIMGVDGKADTVRINQDDGYNKVNDLTVGKYDLVVKTGAGYTTKRQEGVEAMMEMIRGFPDMAAAIGDLVVEAMDVPYADKIAERIRAIQPQQIRDLSDMKDVPPEAQAVIASANAQMQQMQELIQQGQQLLAQKDEEIKLLETEKLSNQDEINMRNIESQRRFETEMAKIQANLQMAHEKESEASRRLIMQEALDALSSKINNFSETVTPTVSNVHKNLQCLTDAIAKINEKVEAPRASKNKTISIVAPSGMTYTGSVTEENENKEISIVAPSGMTYTGSVTEE